MKGRQCPNYYRQKENKNIRTFEKKFSSKNKFSQAPKSTKKYSSKYNGYGSVINIDIASVSAHVRNMLCNLQTQLLQFIYTPK